MYFRLDLWLSGCCYLNQRLVNLRVRPTRQQLTATALGGSELSCPLMLSTVLVELGV